MNDSEILDWIQEHLASFRNTMRDEDDQPYDMEWIDDDGYTHAIQGKDIRECVVDAMKGRYND